MTIPIDARDPRIHSVFADAADAMLIVDDERRIVDANRAGCALFGEPLDARRLDSFVIDADGGGLATAWPELLAFGAARREHRVAAADGQIRLVECEYRAHVDGNGRHLCIARDISDRRLLEERLIQSEKVESVGRLAGGIAHDFNNLLTAILGYTELLLARHPDSNDLERADLLQIEQAGRKAAELTRQLLAYSRKQVLQPRDVDLNLIVANLESMLARLIREDITLSCELASSPAIVKVDPVQIEQALLNLVLNARDALSGGGAIRIDVARVPAVDADVPVEHGARAREYIRVRVSDDGVGIAPELQARVFEPFFTTKAVGQGTGLGLASVHGVVHQSNGTIAVHSVPGKGATFTLHFPAVETAAAKPVAGRTPGEAAVGAETILLVEDEDAVRAIVAEVLKRQGYRVFEAAHPRVACELFDCAPEAIDLLLTDVVMPDMNGPSLAQRLIAVRPDLRVLFISGYSGWALPLDHGNPNVSFLSKPFQASVLAAKVRDVLARRNAGPLPARIAS
jgi:signal transduction histidine kinase/ActR/RegA family two-component response regulator